MPKARPRRLQGIDAILLTIAVGLAALVIRATDRELIGMSVSSFVGRPWSRWPSWLQQWVSSGNRLRPAAFAFLSVFSTGLALVAYRPRRGGRGRSGPGHIAVAIAALFSLFWVVWNVCYRSIVPLIPLPPGTSWGTGPWLFFIHLWATLPPQITWAIAWAWVVLALTGGWRPPIDRADQIGRWVGWCWIATYLWGGLEIAVAMG